MAEERTDAQKAEPMLRVLQRAHEGMLLGEIEEAQRSVTAHVQNTGKPGKIIIEISIRPPSKKSGSAVAVTFEVLEKRPRPDLEADFYYVTEDAGLSRSMPTKGWIGFEKVEKPEEEEVAAGTA